MTEKHRFEVLDPHYERRVRDSFDRQGLMKHLGAELVSLEPGGVEIRVPFRSELTQQHGYFHAGVTGAIADSACGYAAYTLMAAEDSVLTGGVQDEFAGSCGWGGVGGEGAGGAVGQDVEGLYG